MIFGPEISVLFNPSVLETGASIKSGGGVVWIAEYPGLFDTYFRYCRVYHVQMCNSRFWDENLFRLVRVFSEQAGPHEVRVVSLESQNIPGYPFNAYFRNCPVYYVQMCNSWFWWKYVFWLVRVFLQQVCLYEAGVVLLELQNIPDVHLLLIFGNWHIYSVYVGDSWFLPRISASFGQTVLETGASTGGEGGVFGIAEYPRRSVWHLF